MLIQESPSHHLARHISIDMGEVAVVRNKTDTAWTASIEVKVANRWQEYHHNHSELTIGAVLTLVHKIKARGIINLNYWIPVKGE